MDVVCRWRWRSGGGHAFSGGSPTLLGRDLLRRACSAQDFWNSEVLSRGRGIASWAEVNQSVHQSERSRGGSEKQSDRGRRSGESATNCGPDLLEISAVDVYKQQVNQVYIVLANIQSC